MRENPSKSEAEADVDVKIEPWRMDSRGSGLIRRQKSEGAEKLGCCSALAKCVE